MKLKGEQELFLLFEIVFDYFLKVSSINICKLDVFVYLEGIFTFRGLFYITFP